MVFCTTLLVACASPGAQSSPPASASIKSVAAITVVIKNYGFVPTNFTVPAGATVTVRNDDQAIHTLTADNRAFNTGNISRGLPAVFTAPTQRGTYPYHCLFHNYMTGSLTVY